LITGANGFIAGYLSEFLKGNDYEVIGIRRHRGVNVERDNEQSHVYACDTKDENNLKRILKETSPAVIFHLAAQSLPSLSWQEPERTIQENMIGTLNLLKCARTLGLNTRIIIFGSSSEYAPSSNPISEDAPLKPSSPYALSKIGSTMLAKLYQETYGMDIVIVRPFFIIGPRKTADVCSSFARGIVQVERGIARTLHVGNLNSVRDFLDVEDAVKAIFEIHNKAESGETYNISSGIGTPIFKVLEILKSKAQMAISIEEVSPQNRPLDIPVVVGANQKLRGLGWTPKIKLDESLSRILDFWRNDVQRP